MPSPGGTTATNPTKAGTSWPAGKTAFTVVLATTKTRSAAEAKASQATGRGIAAGVLKASNYLGVPGPWVAFAGQYSTLRVARVAAKSYATQGFKGAHANYVKPRPGH